MVYVTTSLACWGASKDFRISIVNIITRNNNSLVGDPHVIIDLNVRLREAPNQRMTTVYIGDTKYWGD